MNFIKNKPGLVLVIVVSSYLSVTSSSLLSNLIKGNKNQSEYNSAITTKKRLIELERFEKYKNMDYKKFEILANKDLLEVLEYLPYHIDKADEEEILKEIVTRDLTTFLINIDKYKNSKYITEIINSIPLEEFLLVSESKIPRYKLFEPINSLLEGVKSITELKLGNTVISLNRLQHKNIYSGLLKTYLADKEEYLNSDSSINRDKVKVHYEANIKKFIKQGKEWAESKENTHTFWVRASHSAGDDNSDAFGYRSEELKKVYKENFTGKGKFHDYSSNVNPQSPEAILDAFEENIKKHPRDNHIFHLGAHGEEDGSALLKGGNRTKKHFDRLFNIKAKYPSNIKIDIGGCRSLNKDTNFYNNTVKNLSMDSGQYRSYGKEGGSDAIFLKTFEEKNEHGNFVADYDGDGIVNFNEALLYRNLNYNHSSTPTMFDDGSGGRAKDISMNDGVYRDTSLYSS